MSGGARSACAPCCPAASKAGARKTRHPAQREAAGASSIDVQPGTRQHPGMFLLIDAGNTRLKLGLYDGHRWLRREALSYDALPYCDWLASSLIAVQRPKVVISNVAGEAVEQQLRLCLGGVLAQTEWLQASLSRCGVRNAYERPLALGADRWAALIGAWHLQQGACLVVNAGTATTVDVLTADALFAGGCILPGLDLMRRSLVQGTARLPLADGVVQALPRNTADAIYNGCLHAQLGAIARMRAQLPAQAPVILSGGAAGYLQGSIDGPVMMAPWLVLDGLLAVAREE